MEGSKYIPDGSEPIANWTRKGLMGRIVNHLGYRPRPEMTKRMVNSAIAYFSGNYHLKPCELNQVTMWELRSVLAAEVGFAYNQTDRWKQSGEDKDSPRPYRWAELRAIVQAMDQHDDQRSWVPERGNGGAASA